MAEMEETRKDSLKVIHFPNTITIKMPLIQGFIEKYIYCNLHVCDTSNLCKIPHTHGETLRGKACSKIYLNLGHKMLVMLW